MKGRHLVRFLAGMIGYSVLLPLSLIALSNAQSDGPAAIVVAVLPVVPLFLALSGILGAMRALDELQRRIQLEAVVIAGLLTAFVTFTYGLMEASELAPEISMIWVLPFMVIVWGIAAAVGARRYG